MHFKGTYFLGFLLVGIDDDDDDDDDEDDDGGQGPQYFAVRRFSHADFHTEQLKLLFAVEFAACHRKNAGFCYIYTGLY